MGQSSFEKGSETDIIQIIYFLNFRNMKKLLLIFLLLCWFILTGCSRDIKNNQANNFNLQVQCSEQAKIFFNNYKTDNNNEAELFYKSHYNSKLNKCFILIDSVFSNVSFSDLYDVLENKHYAIFINHYKDCHEDSSNLENNINWCEKNSGTIWFKGNDQESPDFETSKPWNKNTEKEFLDQIEYFMND